MIRRRINILVGLFFGRKDDKFTKGQQKFKILKKYKKNTLKDTTEILVDKNVIEKLST